MATLYLSRRAAFEAAHSYWLPGLSPEENRGLFGAAANPNGHGHNYVCEATVAGRVEPRTGVVLNIVELDRKLKETVRQLDHKFINREHPHFVRRAPSCENLAAFLFAELGPAVGGALLCRVRLFESRRLWATRETAGGKQMTTLTRRYEFSAAHRLWSPLLSDQENEELFGKCSATHGHGHDYVLEVTVGGDVDERSGMLTDLDALDRAVREEVVERYDQRHLNYDTEDFARLNPTSENLVLVVWGRLKPRLGDRLRKVGIYETERSYFEYRGEEA